MKNEGEFNAFLSRHFRRHLPRVTSIKVSDRFTAGVSDFILWHEGRSTVLEAKFIKCFGKNGRPTLDHPFSAAQMNFMKNVNHTANGSYGVVGVGDERVMYLLNFSLMSECVEGNLTPEQVKRGLEIPLTKQGVDTLVVALGG
jgi:hypothetical protein